MKKEIRSILLVAMERREQDVEYVQGEYAISWAETGEELELSVSGRPIARYSLKSKYLATLDWNYKKENRYLAYLLEQQGLEVHADSALL